MAERNERDESKTSDDSVEIPVTVEGEEDEETDAEIDAERSGDAGEEDVRESNDEREASSDDEDLDDLYLSPEESDVEVVGDDVEKGVAEEEERPEEGTDDGGESEEVPAVDAEGEADESTTEEEAADGNETPETDDAPSREELLDRVDELEARVEGLEQEREQLKQERDNFEDRMLRAAADLENYRKRAEREKEELRKYGAKEMLEDLLETIDNLERAVEHSGEGGEENIIEGVEMVLRQIHGTLANHGVEAFESEGAEFDPEYHEAIQQIETTDAESGEILEEYQKGYTIHDRLLRPAMVSVAKNVGETSEDTGETSSVEAETSEPTGEGDGTADDEAATEPNREETSEPTDAADYDGEDANDDSDRE